MAKLFEFKLVIHRLIKHLEKKELTDSERYMIDGAKKFLQRHSSVEDCLRESEQPEVKTDRQKAIEWWEDSSTLLTVPIWMKKYNMPHLCIKAIEDWEVEIIWRGETQPKDTSGMQDEELKKVVHEIAWAAWKSAANAYRMYPDNKHTFTDYWGDLGKAESEKLLSPLLSTQQGEDADFERGYAAGYNDAVKEARKEITEHYRPNNE